MPAHCLPAAACMRVAPLQLAARALALLATHSAAACGLLLRRRRRPRGTQQRRSLLGGPSTFHLYNFNIFIVKC